MVFLKHRQPHSGFRCAPLPRRKDGKGRVGHYSLATRFLIATIIRRAMRKRIPEPE